MNYFPDTYDGHDCEHYYDGYTADWKTVIILMMLIFLLAYALYPERRVP